MKIISVFNNKGGVGKSTLSFHLGKALGLMGKKVLFVDLDPQCNLTISAMVIIGFYIILNCGLHYIRAYKYSEFTYEHIPQIYSCDSTKTIRIAFFVSFVIRNRLSVRSFTSQQILPSASSTISCARFWKMFFLRSVR